MASMPGLLSNPSPAMPGGLLTKTARPGIRSLSQNGYGTSTKMTHSGEDPLHPLISMLAACSRAPSRAKCFVYFATPKSPPEPGNIEIRGAGGSGKGTVPWTDVRLFFANTGIVKLSQPLLSRILKDRTSPKSPGGGVDSTFDSTSARIALAPTGQCGFSSASELP